MQISKDQVLRFLEEHGQATTATRAQTELPDVVDTDQHADLLQNLRIDVGSVLGSHGDDGPILGRLAE